MYGSISSKRRLQERREVLVTDTDYDDTEVEETAACKFNFFK